MHGLHPARHEVHEQVVAQRLGCREVSLAAAHGAYLLHELHQGEVVGQHEGVDHDAGSLASRDLFERLLDHQRVEAKGILVDATVGQRERRWLAVGDHHDLLHVLVLLGENALRQAQAVAGVGVVRAYFDARELRDGNLFCGVVEEDEVQRVAGKLRADQVRERHGDALRWRKAVFAVEDHRVRAVEQNDRGA